MRCWQKSFSHQQRKHERGSFPGLHSSVFATVFAPLSVCLCADGLSLFLSAGFLRLSLGNPLNLKKKPKRSLPGLTSRVQRKSRSLMHPFPLIPDMHLAWTQCINHPQAFLLPGSLIFIPLALLRQQHEAGMNLILFATRRLFKHSRGVFLIPQKSQAAVLLRGALCCFLLSLGRWSYADLL